MVRGTEEMPERADGGSAFGDGSGPGGAGPGGRLGEYLLVAPLGAGGMSRVFLARSASGRLVAVKVVHPHLAADPGSGNGSGGRRQRHEPSADLSPRPSWVPIPRPDTLGWPSSSVPVPPFRRRWPRSVRWTPGTSPRSALHSRRR